MSDHDVRRYLDGEFDWEDLPSTAREEARSWDHLLGSFRAATPVTPPPPWLEDRVMEEIEALPARGWAGRTVRWMMRPRQVGIPPIVTGLAAAAVVSLLLTPVWQARNTQAPTGAVTSTPDAIVYVQFLLQAPGAQSVSVGGDFDGWNGSHALADPDGDGVWTGRVPVGPGVHSYMFLVDEATWVTDPLAERYADDGFGNRNAVLAVAAPST